MTDQSTVVPVQVLEPGTLSSVTPGIEMTDVKEQHQHDATPASDLRRALSKVKSRSMTSHVSGTSELNGAAGSGLGSSGLGDTTTATTKGATGIAAGLSDDVKLIMNMTKAEIIKNAKKTGLELIAYLIFMLFFSVSTYLSRGDEKTFYLSDRMKKNFLQRDFGLDAGGEKTFYDVSSILDVWLFLEGPMLDFLFSEDLDFMQPKPDDSLYYPNSHNKILGGVRIRQQRVKENSCNVISKYENKIEQCYATVSDNTELRTDINGDSGQVYEWQSATQTDEPSYWGKLDTYSGGGYVTDLPLDYDFVKDWLINARNDSYIGVATRIIIVDVQAYNPTHNLHFFGRCVFEFPATGGVRPKADFLTQRVNRYDDSTGTGQAVVEICLGVFILGFFIQELYELWKHGKAYMNDLWNVVDIVNLLVFVGVYLVKLLVILALDKEDPVMIDTRYISLQNVLYLLLAEGYMSAINAFLLWLKLFKFLSFNPRIKFLYRTFQKSSRDLLYFSLLFAIFIIAFAHAGYLGFSSDVQDFRSFSISFLSLFAAIIGELDYDELAESNRIFGPLFFITFQVVILLVLVNMFLAIVSDAYTSVREEDSKIPQTHDFGFGFSVLFEDVFGLSKNKETRKKQEQLLAAADKDNDDMVTQGELKQTLIDVAAAEKPHADSRIISDQAHADAEHLMKAFDVNDDGNLDVKEMADLKRFVSQGGPRPVSSAGKIMSTKRGSVSVVLHGSQGNQNVHLVQDNAAERLDRIEEQLEDLLAMMMRIDKKLTKRN